MSRAKRASRRMSAGSAILWKMIDTVKGVDVDFLVSTDAIYRAFLGSRYSTPPERIEGGFRFYMHHRGYVADYIRTGELTWDAAMWDIGGPENTTYSSDDDSLLRLVSAITFGENPDLAPDHSESFAIPAHSLVEVNPAQSMASSVRSTTYDLPRKYIYADLHNRIPSLIMTQAGGACPFQAEGTIDGQAFYFRYRGGSASLRVGEQTEGEVISASLWSAGMEYGHGLDGDLSPAEFTYLFCSLVRGLEKSMYRYDFYLKSEGPGAVITKTRSDGTTYTRPKHLFGWGHNPWDARRECCEREKDYRERFPTEYLDDPAPELCDYVTDTIDTRVYPKVRPAFHVTSVPEPTISWEGYESEAARDAAVEEMLEKVRKAL